MRENRLSGSEGGGTEPNQFLLPLSGGTASVLRRANDGSRPFMPRIGGRRRRSSSRRFAQHARTQDAWVLPGYARILRARVLRRAHDRSRPLQAVCSARAHAGCVRTQEALRACSDGQMMIAADRSCRESAEGDEEVLPGGLLSTRARRMRAYPGGTARVLRRANDGSRPFMPRIGGRRGRGSSRRFAQHARTQDACEPRAKTPGR
jgi:hypothetical protein